MKIVWIFAGLFLVYLGWNFNRRPIYLPFDKEIVDLPENEYIDLPKTVIGKIPIIEGRCNLVKNCYAFDYSGRLYLTKVTLPTATYTESPIKDLKNKIFIRSVARRNRNFQDPI